MANMMETVQTKPTTIKHGEGEEDKSLLAESKKESKLTELAVGDATHDSLPNEELATGEGMEVPILQNFTDLKIEVGKDEEACGGKDTPVSKLTEDSVTEDSETNEELEVKSNPNICPKSFDLPKTSTDEEMGNVGKSSLFAEPEMSEKSRSHRKFRGRLHFPKFRMPRNSIQRLRLGSTHGQLVEEATSPVNTLERNQEPLSKYYATKESGIGKQRSKRERLRNIWSGAKKSVTSCSCIRRGDGSEQYNFEDKFNTLDESIDIPRDLTSIANENVEEVEDRKAVVTDK